MELEFRYPENAFLQSPLPDSQRDALQLSRIACHDCSDRDESRRRSAKSEVSGLIDEDGSVAHAEKLSFTENTLSNACRLRVRFLVLVSVIPVG
jgi:hypothetical protein